MKASANPEDILQFLRGASTSVSFRVRYKDLDRLLKGQPIVVTIKGVSYNIKRRQQRPRKNGKK